MLEMNLSSVDSNRLLLQLKRHDLQMEMMSF